MRGKITAMLDGSGPAPQKRDRFVIMGEDFGEIVEAKQVGHLREFEILLSTTEENWKKLLSISTKKTRSNHPHTDIFL